MAKRFSLDISAWVEKAGDRADLVVRKTSLDLFSKVVLKSPVDTGRFRANWMAGVDSIPTGTTPQTDASGSGAIARMTATVTGARAGDRIYLANNLPYATRLEFGHSKQAPAGMVRTTIDEFQAAVSKAAAEAQKERP